MRCSSWRNAATAGNRGSAASTAADTSRAAPSPAIGRTVRSSRWADSARPLTSITPAPRAAGRGRSENGRSRSGSAARSPRRGGAGRQRGRGAGDPVLAGHILQPDPALARKGWPGPERDEHRVAKQVDELDAVGSRRLILRAEDEPDVEAFPRGMPSSASCVLASEKVTSTAGCAARNAPIASTTSAAPADGIEPIEPGRCRLPAARPARARRRSRCRGSPPRGEQRGAGVGETGPARRDRRAACRPRIERRRCRRCGLGEVQRTGGGRAIPAS